MHEEHPTHFHTVSIVLTFLIPYHWNSNPYEYEVISGYLAVQLHFISALVTP